MSLVSQREGIFLQEQLKKNLKIDATMMRLLVATVRCEHSTMKIL